MKGVSKEFISKLIFITIAGIIVFNFGKVASIFFTLKNACMPLFIGIIFALILNVPMEFFEKKVYRKLKKARKILALWSSVILFVGFFVAFGFLIFPRLVDTIKNVVASFNAGEAFEASASSNAFVQYILKKLQQLTSDFIDRLQEYLPKMIEIASDILRVVINLFLGFFIAILILSNKEALSKQLKKALLAISKRQHIKDIMDTLHLAVEKFSKYMGGMLIEAVILGIMCYVLMSIIGLPYAPLIAVIIGFANLIPIIGAYAGGAFSALLIFSVSPEQALIFIIFVVLLQQLESVTTYPMIVGKHVGLSSFWIVVALILGGSLFGFIGVFLAVPVMAFLHDFVGGILAKKKNKNLLYLDAKEDNVIK